MNTDMDQIRRGSSINFGGSKGVAEPAKENDDSIQFFSRRIIKPIYAEILADGRQRRMNTRAFNELLCTQRKPKKMFEGLFVEVCSRIRQAKAEQLIKVNSTYSYGTAARIIIRKAGMLKFIILDIEQAALYEALLIILNKYYKWAKGMIDKALVLNRGTNLLGETVKMDSQCEKKKKAMEKRICNIGAKIQFTNDVKALFCNECDEVDEFINDVTFRLHPYTLEDSNY